MRNRLQQWRPSHTMQIADLTLPREWDEYHFSMYGTAKSGKTTLLRIFQRSICSALPDETRCVQVYCYDIKDQFADEFESLDLPLTIVRVNVTDRRSWAWDAAADCRDPADAEALAHELIPEERAGSGDNPFFTEAARGRAVGFLREATRRGVPWTMRDLYLIATSDFYSRQFFLQSPDPVVRSKLKYLDEGLGRTKSNLDCTIENKLGKVALYAALEDCVPRERRFSFRRLRRSDAVVCFSTPWKLQETFAAINSAMFRTLRNELLDQPDCSYPAERRHYIIADEFPSICGDRPCEGFSKFLEVGRSKGVRVFILCQSPLQLVPLYGEEMTQVIMGQCGNIIVGRLADPEGAAMLSRFLGRVYGHEWTNSVNVGWNQSADGWHRSFSQGASETFADRAAIPEHILMELPSASFTRPWGGYMVIPALPKNRVSRFTITPKFLRRHLPEVPIIGAPDENDDRPYRRLPEDMYLNPLTPSGAAKFHLEFDPESYCPSPVAQYAEDGAGM